MMMLTERLMRLLLFLNYKSHFLSLELKIIDNQQLLFQKVRNLSL